MLCEEKAPVPRRSYRYQHFKACRVFARPQIRQLLRLAVLDPVSTLDVESESCLPHFGGHSDLAATRSGVAASPALHFGRMNSTKNSSFSYVHVIMFCGSLSDGIDQGQVEQIWSSLISTDCLVASPLSGPDLPTRDDRAGPPEPPPGGPFEPIRAPRMLRKSPWQRGW